MRRSRTTLQRITGPTAAEPTLIVKSNAVLLENIFTEYEAKRLRGKSMGAVDHFRTTLKHFGAFLGHVPTVDDLTDDVVNDFQWHLVERRGIVAATAVSYVKKLLALWRYAARHRIADNWPEVELMTIPVRDPIAWTEDEVKTIFAALRSQEGMIGDIPAYCWWPALWNVFYDTAERLAAVLSLTMDDLNLAANWVTFRAEFRKGKLRDRGMPLHADTVADLRRIIDGFPKRKYLFEAPFGVQALLDKYRAILRDAGLPYDRKRLFHCIRRTVASHFESNGHDATELLDHSMRKVTTDSYLSPQIVKRARPASVLFRPETATDREAAKEMRKARQELARTRYAELKKKCGDSLAEWAKAYEDAHPEQCEKTGGLRGRYVRHFAKFLERDATLADVTIKNMMQFALWRIEEEGVSETTADREASAMRAIRRFVDGLVEEAKASKS